MLLRGFEPSLELSHRRPVGPVLIPVPCRRVHNPGDMARAGNDKPDGTTKELCALRTPTAPVRYGPPEPPSGRSGSSPSRGRG